MVAFFLLDLMAACLISVGIGAWSNPPFLLSEFHHPFMQFFTSALCWWGGLLFFGMGVVTWMEEVGKFAEKRNPDNAS